ncbi:MAG: hypothetical protein R6U17_07525 [Thermoplasmata archaeon]
MEVPEMIGKKVLFVVTIVALLGTSLLFILSASQEPPEIGVSDIDGGYLDTVVKTEGYVMDRRNFYGTYHVTIRDQEENQEVVALISSDIMEEVDNKENIIPGAIVSFRGRVEKDGNRYRLRTSSHVDVRVIEEARSSFIPIESILENPTWYENTDVKVRGEVRDIWTISRGTHIILSPLDNPYSRLSCEADDWHVSDEIVKGDYVVVEGYFEYSQWKGMWILRCEGMPEIH